MHSRIYQAGYIAVLDTHVHGDIRAAPQGRHIEEHAHTRETRPTRVRARDGPASTCLPTYVLCSRPNLRLYVYTVHTAAVHVCACMCVHTAYTVYARYIPTRMYMHTLLRHVAVHGYTYRWVKAKEEEEEEEEEKEEKRPKRQTCLASTRPEAHHRCLDLRISVDRRLMPRTRHTAREREREGGRQGG